jgi:hypothetical protein
MRFICIYNRLESSDTYVGMDDAAGVFAQLVSCCKGRPLVGLVTARSTFLCHPLVASTSVCPSHTLRGLRLSVIATHQPARLPHSSINYQKHLRRHLGHDLFAVPPRDLGHDPVTPRTDAASHPFVSKVSCFPFHTPRVPLPILTGVTLPRVSLSAPCYRNVFSSSLHRSIYQGNAWDRFLCLTLRLR